MSVHVGDDRRLAGISPASSFRGGAASGVLGIRAWGTGEGAARLIRKPELGRIDWWRWPSLGWPVAGAATSPAARSSGELRQRRRVALADELKS
jgi:hypothetical protein